MIAPSDAPLKASLPPPPPAPRLHFIDGLRGLAMLMVLCFHMALFGGGWGAANSVFSYGYVGVNLFLVLSGFCLYWPFAATLPGRLPRREPTLWQFAQKRCRRILPPYYVALLFFWAVLLLDVATHHHFHEDATNFRHVFLSLAWHLVMLHNLRPEYALSIDGVFWSLALEFSLYILFPLLVEGFRRMGPWLTIAVVLAINLAWGEAVRGIAPYMSNTQAFVLNNSLPGRCFEFAAGMAAARLIAGGRMSVLPAALLWLGTAAAAVWATGQCGAVTAIPNILWGLSFAALLTAAATPQGWLHRALSARWLVTLGVFSYSVYLIHLPLTKLLTALALHYHLPAVPFGLLVILPACLTLGYVFFLKFEKPLLRSPK